MSSSFQFLQMISTPYLLLLAWFNRACWTEW